jgi:hypothetical protein
MVTAGTHTTCSQAKPRRRADRTTPERKTTLARQILPNGSGNYFDPEDPTSRAPAKALNAFEPDQAHFWATHQGAELDLLMFKRGRRIGIEIKRADAPTITPSMRIALADLALDQLIVLYPGSRVYDLDRRVHVLPLSHLADGNHKAILGKLQRQPRTRRS